MIQLNLVYTTFSNLEQAKKMTQLLLKDQLIACANIYSTMTSVYTWQGKIQQESEIPVIFKTTEKKVKELQKMIERNHPYDTPCITVIKPEDTNKAFLDWLAKSLCD